MKLICLVKVVPDVEHFAYDYERNVLIREGVPQILNPEDVAALAFAFEVKRRYPNTTIETVTMAPIGALPHIEDLIRRGVDRATLISDRSYVGSDTYVTSRILARHLSGQCYDWILSGTHSLDGGTAHIAPQIAELLDIPQLSEVLEIDCDGLVNRETTVDVDNGDSVLRFTVEAPAVLSLQYATRLKLPYIAYERIDLDVSDQIDMINNDRLGFEDHEVGIKGSRTRVAKAEVHAEKQKNTRFVTCDDAGIETVYEFLVEKGLIR